MQVPKDTNFTVVFASCILLISCSQVQQPEHNKQDHYLSPHIQLSTEKISRKALQKEFRLSASRAGLSERMHDFELRVNEIYQGEDAITIEAKQNGNKLLVRGFVDKNQREGYQAQDDETLFLIEEESDPSVQNENRQKSGNENRRESKHSGSGSAFSRSLRRGLNR